VFNLKEMSVCPATTGTNFPHHYRCIYDKGHLGANCEPNCKGHCEAYECSLEDGTRRTPDGSIVARDHLKNGGIAICKRNLNNNEAEVVVIQR
jgi:hypothetical protein